MFTATIKKAIVFKKIVNILNNLFHSIYIHIENNCIKILMVTTCGKMLFDISLDFDEFVGDQPITFSVDSKHLLQSLKSLKVTDSVVLKINSDAPNKLIIENVSYNFTDEFFCFITETQSLTNDDEFQYENVIEAKNSKFQKLCKQFRDISPELIVNSNSKYITFSSKLEKMVGRSYTIGDKTGSGEEEFVGVYSAENFVNISTISGLSNTLYFYVSKHNPLGIEARFGKSDYFKVWLKNSNECEP